MLVSLPDWSVSVSQNVTCDLLLEPYTNSYLFGNSLPRIQERRTTKWTGIFIFVHFLSEDSCRVLLWYVLHCKLVWVQSRNEYRVQAIWILEYRVVYGWMYGIWKSIECVWEYGHKTKIWGCKNTRRGPSIIMAVLIISVLINHEYMSSSVS